jgi:oligopeptide/dipeptide ABC transporter ATP-binding protein
MSLETTRQAADGEVLLRVENLVKYFPVKSSSLLPGRREYVHAVENVSLQVRRGETLGLVGETGCGKSTLARCAARLYPVTSGRIFFGGREITTLSARRMRPLRREIQIIFQDPYGSLNPRRRVGSIIGDPFAIHRTARGKARKRQVQHLMELVGLNPEHYNRFPAEFSGGQRQRIGVARALAFRPKLIICDEPVSALDVSIQAQILDLSVVRHVSDRVAVMYLGKIVEESPADVMWAHPRHPYTDALLSAVPLPDPEHAQQRERIILAGDVPSPIGPPSGCRFHPRCPKARPLCVATEPELAARLGDPADHVAACHFPVADGEDISLATPSIAADQRVIESGLIAGA